MRSAPHRPRPAQESVWDYPRPPRLEDCAKRIDVVVGDRRLARCAWSYPDPAAACAAIRDHVAFYCAPMDVCLVDGEKAHPQPGGFYGGWITDDVVGPFKGKPGTGGW
jgi:uncharacterized protein (DUF427 family)